MPSWAPCGCPRDGKGVVGRRERTARGGGGSLVTLVTRRSPTTLTQRVATTTMHRLTYGPRLDGASAKTKRRRRRRRRSQNAWLSRDALGDEHGNRRVGRRAPPQALPAAAAVARVARLRRAALLVLLAVVDRPLLVVVKRRDPDVPQHYEPRSRGSARARRSGPRRRPRAP